MPRTNTAMATHWRSPAAAAAPRPDRQPRRGTPPATWRPGSRSATPATTLRLSAARQRFIQEVNQRGRGAQFCLRPVEIVARTADAPAAPRPPGPCVSNSARVILWIGGGTRGVFRGIDEPPGRSASASFCTSAAAGCQQPAVARQLLGRHVAGAHATSSPSSPKLKYTPGVVCWSSPSSGGRIDMFAPMLVL